MAAKIRLVRPEPVAPSPQKNEHERAAAEVVALLDQIRARIPSLVAPSPANQRRVRGARTVPREYVLAMIDTAEDHPLLQIMPEMLDPAKARDAVQFEEAFKPVAERIALLLASLKHTMALRVTEVVELALKTYVVGKSAAHGNDELYTRLDRAARMLNRKGKAKRKKK